MIRMMIAGILLAMPATAAAQDSTFDLRYEWGFQRGDADHAYDADRAGYADEAVSATPDASQRV